MPFQQEQDVFLKTKTLMQILDTFAKK